MILVHDLKKNHEQQNQVSAKNMFYLSSWLQWVKNTTWTLCYLWSCFSEFHLSFCFRWVSVCRVRAGRGVTWTQPNARTASMTPSQRTLSPLLSASSSTTLMGCLSIPILRVLSSSRTPGLSFPIYKISITSISIMNKRKLKFVIIIWYFCYLTLGLFFASVASFCSLVLSCRVSCRYVLYIHLVINDMIMLTVTVMLQILTYTAPLSFAPCCVILLISVTTNK